MRSRGPWLCRARLIAPSLKERSHRHVSPSAALDEATDERVYSPRGRSSDRPTERRCPRRRLARMMALHDDRFMPRCRVAQGLLGCPSTLHAALPCRARPAWLPFNVESATEDGALADLMAVGGLLGPLWEPSQFAFGTLRRPIHAALPCHAKLPATAIHEHKPSRTRLIYASDPCDRRGYRSRWR